jgi:hypothetical protein
MRFITAINKSGWNYGRVVIARSDGDEAIQFFADFLDCFASLAMTRIQANHL